MAKALAAILVVLAALAGVAAYLSMFIVHVNEQAVVLTFGSPEQVINQPGGKYRPGLYFRIPLVQTVDYFDKRILDLDTPSYEVNALDQKRLNVDAFARYRITDPLLFYQSVRSERGVQDRLKPIIESSLRRVLGGATFQEIVRDKREDLMKRIAKQVNEDGKEFGLEVVDVRIKRADLPEQNQKNVFERMRAERQREAAEIRAEGTGASSKIKADADRQVTVIKAEAMREADRIRGEGDAERNRIFAEAYNRDPDFFAFYRSMQAYEAGMKSGESETRMLLSPDSEFFKYFNNPNGSAGQPRK
ncbi:MAG TPA: protease modulator HflC [Hyphomicrobiaceae bacterium]|jgi:membrane protease subunit HflC|nr:protease modulator HflC [Hyphomicrobiaceae bacterium]